MENKRFQVAMLNKPKGEIVLYEQVIIEKLEDCPRK